ncbi:LysR family transcriptional regulator [Polyangium sp. y55x31]|uniref:LysR family transcriptional regulator n=1 Tax=Polyangium sp. y55x31 TaxID=3042688 RepID=UPI0024832BC3|nr:LysR family transcriptional regulator [Polyangium sp. y55x31]MDI1476452.1 LysR family transcriptional regulator [Polyangium sp. y55x31]
MRDDHLTGLLAFLAVAEKRSFTAAGAELGVTPSAVSQQLRQLEERLGVRLLQRTTRSVGLTEAGQRFFERVRPAIDDVGAAIEGLNEFRDRPAGTLRLNVPRIAVEMVIEPVLAPFLAAYPEMRIEVGIDDALANLVESGFDAGIRLGETLDKEMVAVRIGPDLRMAIVGAPAYFATRGVPKHPRELHRHDCIRYRQPTSGAIYKWEFDEDGKEFEMAVEGRVTANEAALMVRAALDGLGLAYVMDDYVRDELRAGRLVRVLEPFCAPFPGFHLYYPSRSQMPLKLKVFVNFLRARGATPKRRR